MKPIPENHRLSREGVLGFMQSLSNWGRWGEEDQLGALNLITDEKRAAAAALVRDGEAVSAARALPTEPAADNPQPVRHLMIATGLDKEAIYSADYFSLSHHGYCVTHLDALCHIFYGEALYNGFSRSTVTSSGAARNSIDVLKNGIITRGILLDVPAARGLPYLEPGDPIFPDDLERAEEHSGVRAEAGDFLLIRTGRFAFREEHGAWNARELMAGLHASCLPWLRQREIAALGCDGNSDVIPSRVEGIRLPVHLVAIAAMGVHLLDNADLEALGRACRKRNRWEFLFVVSPLVLLRGTGSPVNPLAVF